MISQSNNTSHALESATSDTIPTSTACWHADFLKILPKIQDHASYMFRHLQGDNRDEVIQEVRTGDVFARPLRFTPYAWGKLMFLRDLGGTEVGGFGISSEDDLFLIEDFVLVKQACTQVTVAFDDQAVADFFEDQVELGRQPERFARCWIHTHPSDSANPSGTDEETFARVFG